MLALESKVGNSDLGELSKSNDFEDGGMRPAGLLVTQCGFKQLGQVAGRLYCLHRLVVAVRLIAKASW